MKNVRLLFIDDEEELVEDFSIVLGGMGFDVVSTTDVAEAIKLFQESTFDVVLTDIAMPPSEDMEAESVAFWRETGIALARQLHEAQPSIPIVALTVIRDEKIMESMRNAGIEYILHKPQDPEPIARTLRTVIRR